MIICLYVKKKKHVLELNVKSLDYIGIEYDISSKIITFCCKNFEKATGVRQKIAFHSLDEIDKVKNLKNYDFFLKLYCKKKL